MKNRNMWFPIWRRIRSFSWGKAAGNAPRWTAGEKSRTYGDSWKRRGENVRRPWWLRGGKVGGTKGRHGGRKDSRSRWGQWERIRTRQGERKGTRRKRQKNAGLLCWLATGSLHNASCTRDQTLLFLCFFSFFFFFVSSLSLAYKCSEIFFHVSTLESLYKLRTPYDFFLDFLTIIHRYLTNNFVEMYWYLIILREFFFFLSSCRTQCTVIIIRPLEILGLGKKFYNRDLNK